MKRAIGLPATPPVMQGKDARKKRGFSLHLAANAAGHIHVPWAARGEVSFMHSGTGAAR
jgi:hypothetical protein